MSLTLYFAAGSCSLPALVGLEEAGAVFDPVRLVLPNGDQRRPEYLAIHPRGRVPVLVADDVAIGENIAVLTAIAQRFPAARLLPAHDPLQLARAYELLAWFASGVHVAFAQVGRPERYTPDTAAWPALKAGGRENMLAAYAEIDARLEDGRPWLLGEDFSLADPYAHVFYRWAPRLEIDMADYPAFHAHAERLQARPAVQRAFRHEVSDRTLIPA
jgi:glutathione S-transferase